MFTCSEYSVMPVKTDSDVAREMKELDIRFLMLADRAEDEIDQEIVRRGDSPQRILFQRQFHHHLTTLPPDLRQEHYQFIQQHLKETQDPVEIFLELSMYWDFVNYSLLEHVINEFGSDQLKADMRQYVADLEEFRKTTTVAQFAKHWNGKRGTEIPHPHFTELMAKLPEDPSTYTLQDLETLRRDTCREFSLSTLAVKLSATSGE